MALYFESKPKARKPAALQIPTDYYSPRGLHSPVASPGSKPSTPSAKHAQTRPPAPAPQNGPPFSPQSKVTSSSPTKSCLCSPTTHAGSFRCRLHRSSQTQWISSRKLPSSPAGTVQTAQPAVPSTVEAQ